MEDLICLLATVRTLNLGHSIRDNTSSFCSSLRPRVHLNMTHYSKYIKIRLALNFSYKNYIKFKEELMSANLEYKFKY